MTASGPVSTVNKGGQFTKMIDTSQKVSVSGKNLINLTQSAEARDEQDKYVS